MKILRRGFTLVEMLVVISIMMILVALAAKMLPQNTDERRVREASRALNVYLSTARNRAIELGRPCGVIFRCLPNAPCAATLEQCEVPPCYSGLSQLSLAYVYYYNGLHVYFDPTTNPVPIPEQMVRPGDLIQFNGQGPMYILASIDVSKDTSGREDPNTGFFTSQTQMGGGNPESNNALRYFNLVQDGVVQTNEPWVVFQSNPSMNDILKVVPPVSYRIFRSPVKSAAMPLQLPSGSVVDLNASGHGSNFATAMNPPGPKDFTVMFSPNGAVDRVYYGGNDFLTSETVFLLLGRQSRVGIPFVMDNPNEGTMTNYQNLNNFWVTIGASSGTIGTEPVANSLGANNDQNAILRSRDLAIQGKGTGGR